MKGSGPQTPILSRILIGVQLVLGAALVASWLRWPLKWAWAPPQLGLLALVCLLVAGTIAARAYFDLGRAFQIFPDPRADARLVRHGIYRWLRHPMYTSVCLIAVGMFLHHLGAATFATMLANVAFYVGKARYEERLLRRHYPDYARYQSNTWGVIPWPRRSTTG